MGNERLRGRMQHAGLTTTDLASAIAVDPKTVERWLSNGRIPHRRHRQAAAQALDVEETYLWPSLITEDRAVRTSDSEILRVYPNRGAVPHDLWAYLISASTRHLDVLVYAGLFLVDGHPDLPTRLRERAADGLQGRLLYGDPDSHAVARRGEEEGIGANLAARIRLALTYMEPALEVDGVEGRLHQTVLYNSIFRFDDQMLVNTHILGTPAAQNPVLHLQRVQGGQLFDNYLRSFEHVWEVATPLEAVPSP